MSLGIEVGRLRQLLLDKATEWTQSVYDCPQLARLNEAAEQALAQANRPMPPFVGNLKGFRINLESANLTDFSPQEARGLFVLEVEKPQMLAGMAQMLVPGMEEMNLEPGGDPVVMPEELMHVAVEGMQVTAAMSRDAIGVSLGEEQKDNLMEFLEADADNGNVFFSMSYDMAAQLQMQARVQQNLLEEAAEEGRSGENEELMRMVRDMQTAYMEMLGRARLEVSFTPEGVVFYNRVTFK